MFKRFLSLLAEVCSLRLDFEMFNLRASSNTGELPGTMDCVDMFTIAVSIYL